MLQRHELEVRHLYPRPDHPILGQGRRVGRVQLFLWVRPFHDCHRGQEAKQVDAGEHGLVKSNPRDDLQVRLSWELYFSLKEAVPGRRGWTEHS